MAELCERDLKKIYATLAYIDLNKGLIGNTEKLKLLDTIRGVKVWEIKVFQIRIACVRQQGIFILLHAFFKKQDDWPKNHLEIVKNAISKLQGVPHA